MQRTEAQMKLRLLYLDGVFKQHNLSLREAGERDAILNHGLKGWNDYLNKK